MEDNKIPRTLPVIHINNVVMYPHLMIPLIIVEDNLKKVIEHAIKNDKYIGFFLAKEVKDNGETIVYEYGTVVSIIRMMRNADGSINMLLQGISRIKIDRITQHHPYMMVEVNEIIENPIDTAKLRALRNITLELVDKIITESSDYNKDLNFGLANIKQHGRVADIIAGNLPFTPEIKQELLQTIDFIKRFEKLNKHLADMIKQMKLETSIRNNIQLEIDEDQKRYYLREQLEAIKRELGEFSEAEEYIRNWKRKAAKANLPEYVLTEANEELKKLSIMSPISSDYSVTRNYLDWLISVPWNVFSVDNLDLTQIEKVLAEDHYGLEKIKERIIEYIAVKKLKEENKSSSREKAPILCFVGPPGVGKTSIGQSIAKALGRKFIRMSLGGIHDESEIRGHRRTYVGSMPGKIISEIKRCGTNNPVFMLDEIDKVGKDFRGDPASALLEVLDPEQNNAFMDNFINLPFDLSKCFFITTANSTDTIPSALLDRMEMLEFSSYIEEEKIEIANKYLIPKELENNGISLNNIKFNKDALIEIIRYYIKEAGVRNLQRSIASVMRKIARKVAIEQEYSVVVSADKINDYLGYRKFTLELSGRKPEIGIVTGLAWTSFGGEILFVESNKMVGKGNLVLTGRLGVVMQESAKIAFSFIKSNCKKYNIKPEIFNKFDFHVHVPAGATPKDGPSAGVSLTTSIISLLTGKSVKHDIAMTGEITLFGKVLPVGGIKEKVLAAKRAGIKKVILPAENRDSFDDIPAYAGKGIKPIFVTHIDEVLKLIIN
jgi:ATP-dependent Lon protease